MKKLYLILVFFIFCSFSLKDVFSKKEYIYKNQTGNKTFKTKWIITNKKDNFIIKKTNSIGITDMIYSMDFILQQLTYKSDIENIHYLFTKEGNKLIAKGKYKGQSNMKTYSTASILWIQEFNYGLKQFLQSNKNELKFFIINPKNFSKNIMIATKESKQKLKVGKETYDALKLKVTLTGFKSMFWKAEIWYDLKTYNLIKYKANEGPGTPMNIITLESEK